jgi:hypothetical protein
MRSVGVNIDSASAGVTGTHRKPFGRATVHNINEDSLGNLLGELRMLTK